jgi:AbrB family looped-hinge helix DNA binding protein
MTIYRTTISSKGQVVLPVELRQRLGLKKGTRATWTEDRGRIVLTPMNERLLDEIQGFLEPGPGEESAFDALFEERERERKREQEKEK